jgi:hypothetical protein
LATELNQNIKEQKTGNQQGEKGELVTPTNFIQFNQDVEANQQVTTNFDGLT